MQGHIYHWKHGWIPITPRAAMIKAKGSHSLGESYMHRYGIADRRAGGERRVKPEGLAGGTRGSHTDSRTKRGGFEYVRGTKTRQYPDRAPSAGEVPAGGPKSASEAFAMGRKDLEPHAKAGNPHAQAELNRRAVKNGKPAPYPAPESTPPARHPDAPKPTTKPSTPPAAHPEAPKPAPTVEDARKALEEGRLSPREFARRYPGVEMAPKAPEAPSAPKAPETAMDDVDLSAQLPEGHIVSSTTTMGGDVYSRHLTADSTRTVGVVQGSDAKGFAAYRYTYRRPNQMVGTRNSLGTFPTRLEAHQAIAKAHIDAKAAQATKEAKAAEAATRKAAKLGGLAGPNGTTWQAHELPDDGTLGSKAARAKAKQVYKAGDHTVVIESAMSAQQTKGLLGDITSALERSAPNLKGTGVKFIVPTGDSTFRPKARGVVGAYVHRGGTTVHINPRVANNDLADAFARGGHTGHFMPAAKTVPAREYTILHELGHVTHNVHGHVNVGPFSPPEGNLSSVRHAHSKYGQSSPREGYAEAFAQHSIGGQGSHTVSDAYAEHYGWNAPGTPTLRDATSTGAQLKDATTVGPTNQQKIDNAARMYGTGSPQHRTALARFGGK